MNIERALELISEDTSVLTKEEKDKLLSIGRKIERKKRVAVMPESLEKNIALEKNILLEKVLRLDDLTEALHSFSLTIPLKTTEITAEQLITMIYHEKNRTLEERNRLIYLND